MSKKLKKSKSDFKISGVSFVKKYKDITEYRLENGLSILYMHMPDTGVITTNITYRVGARDEVVGQTGIAHMLEHMLFKPTEADLQQKIDSGAMQFERETGCILNANTWKDRTTYFFSYPKKYFQRALQVEAERMHGVVLSDAEFLPERNNVLSEFDMYFGDPYFALEVDMVCSAFHSHPYGHETIGFREDIERYTTETLKAFYEKYYDPNNATLTIVGDVAIETALTEVAAVFGKLKTNGAAPKRTEVIEPKQEGLRRVSIERESRTNIVGFAVKHEGFPDKKWFQTVLLSTILTGGSDSILHEKLVDTGLASKVDMSVEPTQEENVSILYVTLSKKATPAKVEKIVMDTIDSLNVKVLAPRYKKIQQKILTDEIIGRESSLKVAMELTEYVSAGTWGTFFDTETILKEISAQDIVTQAKQIFVLDKMTIGNFIGKK